MFHISKRMVKQNLIQATVKYYVSAMTAFFKVLAAAYPVQFMDSNSYLLSPNASL